MAAALPRRPGLRRRPPRCSLASDPTSMAAHSHPPPAAHGTAAMRSHQRRALRLCLVANAAFLVVEVVAGAAFHSLALLADAAHMLSDVTALAIALVAQRLMTRPATGRHSYGLQRAEVLGALVNGVVLVLASGWIVFEAVHRLGDEADVAGAGLVVVATLGLAVNLGSAAVLARVEGDSLNMHGALVHMLADAVGSVGAIVAGIAVVVWGAVWVDPVVSVLIALLVLWSAWGLLRDTVNVLLEATPRGLDAAEVITSMAEDPAVQLVHHVHVWNLASDAPALSAHVVLNGDVSLHDAQAHGDELKAMLAERFGIAHATLELECHPCVEEDAGHVHHHPGGASAGQEPGQLVEQLPGEVADGADAL